MHRRAFIALLPASMLLVVACSAPPTTEDTAAPAGPTEETTAGTTPASETTAAMEAGALEDVYAQVEGLTGQERQDKLVELAMAEQEGGGAFTWYASMNLEESEPMASAFEDAFDIEPALYRASSETVLRRILEEADANFSQADVVVLNGPEMNILSAEGLLGSLDTPATEDIVDVGVFGDWSAAYLNVFVAAWNTNEVSPEEAPTTYEELFSNFQGTLAMELGDFDWFATLVKQYFMEGQGMTEEEAVDQFRQAAAGAKVVDGHTLMTELTAAGEFDVGTSHYQHRVLHLQNEGAPLAWEPPIQPLVVRPNGVAVHRETDRPATALLFLEWFLGPEAQETLGGLERTPANTAVGGGIPQEYETLLVDLAALQDEREKWESLYEEVIRQAGEVVEE